MKHFRIFIALILVCLFSVLAFSACEDKSKVTDIYVTGKNEMTVDDQQTLSISNNLGNTDINAYSITSSNELVLSVDNAGKVVALSEGEANISVSCGNVTKTFPITVKYPTINSISKYKAIHKDNAQTFFFAFSDVNGDYIKSNGSIDIKIVNSKGNTVYQKSYNFSSNDFNNYTITYVFSEETFLGCAITINDSEISTSNSAKGTLYANIKVAGISFDELSCAVSTLPADVDITFESTSGTFNSYITSNYIGSTTEVLNATVEYEPPTDDRVYVKLSMTCKCKYFSKNTTYSTVGYKVYDSNNTVVKSGRIYKNVSVGETWTDYTTFYLDIGHYTIVLCDYS
jgi:hypothetical protein